MSKKHKAVLVTGSHRSGTTWVGKTIYQHKEVKYVHEPFNVDYEKGNMYINLNTWFCYAHGSPEEEKIREKFDRFFYSNPFQQSAELCKISENDGKLPLRFLKFLLIPSSRPLTVFKDPIALSSAGWLADNYPIKVICMIRNPLGFVGSLKKAEWDFDFTHIKEQEMLMKEKLQPFTEDVEKVLQKSDFIERACLLWNMLHHIIYEYMQINKDWLFIKYRDIAVDPVQKFSEIFDYTGLKMNDQITQYIQNYTSRSNPKEAENHEYMPRDSKKSLENWKDRLTPEEVEKVKELTNDVFKKLYQNQ